MGESVSFAEKKPGFAEVEMFLQKSLGQVFPAVQVVVRSPQRVIWSAAYGEVGGCPVSEQTRFDWASLTKLVTATAVMQQVAAGSLALAQSLRSILPEFVGERPCCPYEDPLQPGAWLPDPFPSDGTNPRVDPAQVTFYHLLTHTAGLPAWRPLYRQDSRQAAEAMAIQTFFTGQPAQQILYSDIGFILLGLALQRLRRRELDRLMEEEVLHPWGMTATGFLPRDPFAVPPDHPDHIAPTEYCGWRQRRLWGEVHDENAARLGGVAGHAGLFGTATDLAQFGVQFLAGNALSEATRRAMTTPQVAQGGTRRGLGFVWRSGDPQSSSYPFSEDAFGHTGFTGTSLWVDPQRALVVACLSNSVYYGRDHAAILPFRGALHRRIVEVMDARADQ